MYRGEVGYRVEVGVMVLYSAVLIGVECVGLVSSYGFYRVYRVKLGFIEWTQ